MHDIVSPKLFKVLFYVYLVLFPIFLLSTVVFWLTGPIQIAQICGLGSMWSLFGLLINKRFRGVRDD